ncbi:MAG: ankyrin repeat domain-containing protein [Dinghuibacter sp.]|nr:ankyrin repeat domain-containing protein [Dinghuibacter sp.]
MSFLKKLFGGGKKKTGTMPELQWIPAASNPWNQPLLDLRPISETMLAFSESPDIAKNAVSYGGTDGRIFWGQKPALQRTISAGLSIPIDHVLEPGVLFVPDIMEHKWAVYFDGQHILFIRSWLREVFVLATTSQKNSRLYIEQITGTFTDNESPEFTIAIVNYLLISHCIGETVPAPLPKIYEQDAKGAGAWAFSAYGKMMQFGVFNEQFLPTTTGILRSHSLLHIAVAQSNIEEIATQAGNGININALAGDGLATLHWSIACMGTESLKQLLNLGANPNVRSLQGATPLMNAVQSNKMEHLQLLLQSGADVNARDNRGFTALHRAAEMGHIEMVQILLHNGADKHIAAENHTALSLAQHRQHTEIINLLNSN